MQNIIDIIKVINSKNIANRIGTELMSFSDFNRKQWYSTVYCVEDDKFFPCKSDIDQPGRPALITYDYFCNHHFITFEYFPNGKIYYGCNFGSGGLWYIRATTEALLRYHKLVDISEGNNDNADKRRTQQED